MFLLVPAPGLSWTKSRQPLNGCSSAVVRNATSCYSNGTDSLHCHQTFIIQPYLPGGAHMYPSNTRFLVPMWLCFQRYLNWFSCLCMAHPNMQTMLTDHAMSRKAHNYHCLQRWWCVLKTSLHQQCLPMQKLTVIQNRLDWAGFNVPPNTL